MLEYTDIIFDFHHSSFKDINPIRKDTYHINYHAVKQILERNNISVADFDKEAPKEEKHFEDMFSLLQQKILEFLSEFDRVTVVGIAKKLNISMSTARKSVAALKKKNAVIVAGKKRNRELLVIAPYIRRLMVRE